MTVSEELGRLGSRVGAVMLCVTVIGAAAGSRLAPQSPETRSLGLLNAPPTTVRLIDRSGVWHLPFVYPWRRASQLERTYEEDRSRQVPLVWFRGGRLVTSSEPTTAPLLFLGADDQGRDILSRLLEGARLSLGLALFGSLGALAIGCLIGATAGYAGGLFDEILMRVSESILILPAMYAGLALRAVLPLVMSARSVFLLLAVIFSVIGAPLVATGVRGIVKSERDRDYALAAVSVGAGPFRLITRHLLPAARGFLLVQLTALVPAFIVAEATFSYVGLGFPETTASWGAMLRNASTMQALAEFPWLLAPAVAIFLVVLCFNLVTHGRAATLRRVTSTS